MPRFLLAAALLCCSASVLADDCEHAQPRKLDLDLVGVKSITFEVGPHDLVLTGGSSPAGALQGRACASNPKDLDQLTVTQHKSGDSLLVRLKKRESTGWSFFGNQYARLEMTGQVPAHLTIHLKVGSGDARLTGGSNVSAQVGSGDIRIQQVSGLVAGTVGSGDLDVHQAGSLEIFSVGSGDARARDIAGNSRIGSIGSGDFELQAAQGDVEVGSVGSGSVDLQQVKGNVRVDSVGSGDIDTRGVGGNLLVGSLGSGSIHHDGVSGRIDLPRDH